MEMLLRVSQLRLIPVAPKDRGVLQFYSRKTFLTFPTMDGLISEVVSLSLLEVPIRSFTAVRVPSGVGIWATSVILSRT